MKLLPPPGRARRRLLWLVGLLAAVAVLAWVRFRPTGSDGRTSNAVADSPERGGPLPVPDPVKFRDLEGAPVLTAAGRNPFVFGSRPLPPAPSRPLVLPPGGSGPTGTATPALPSGPPPIGLKLTGMTVIPGSGRRMVTLKDPAKGALYQAFEGDIVDGRYRVVKVGVQSVVLSYVDGTGTRTIPLG